MTKADKSTRDGPGPEAVRNALQALADAYNELDPDHHYSVHDPEHPKPGASVVWAATPPTESGGERDPPGSRRTSARPATDPGSAPR